jgi:hypothetical protein
MQLDQRSTTEFDSYTNPLQVRSDWPLTAFYRPQLTSGHCRPPLQRTGRCRSAIEGPVNKQYSRVRLSGQRYLQARQGRCSPQVSNCPRVNRTIQHSKATDKFAQTHQLHMKRQQWLQWHAQLCHAAGRLPPHSCCCSCRCTTLLTTCCSQARHTGRIAEHDILHPLAYACGPCI